MNVSTYIPARKRFTIMEEIMQDFIRIHENDNVAVALKPIEKGSELNVDGISVTAAEDIPQGHKFALKPIAAGKEVIKYGFRIGYAKKNI